MSYGFVYLLQEREFCKTNKNIYVLKCTKCNQDISKLLYPKNSFIWSFTLCKNLVKTKNEISRVFKQKYVQRKDIGDCYFQGDLYNMSGDIYDIILKQNELENNANTSNFSGLDVLKCDAKISDIVLTDRESLRGHILFDNATEWTESVNVKDYLQYKSHLISDDIVQELCSSNFVENPSYYELKYNEYFVNNDIGGTCIINTLDLTVTEYKPTRHNILTNYQKPIFEIPLVTFDCIDTLIVDNILKKLLPKYDDIQKYKALCYNLLVDQSDDIILYDSSSYLAMWIISLLHKISSPNNSYTIDENNSSNYMDYLSDSAYNNNIRVVYIKNTKMLNKKLKFLKQYGIKNIIIQGNMTDNDKVEFIKYVKTQIGLLDTVEKYIFEIDEMNIFGNPKLLLRNFLKWCCVP